MRRKTAETDISIDIGVDSNSVKLDDVVLRHMLNTLFFYMNSNVRINAEYDMRHHLWEDMGIAFGQVISSSFDRNRIQRYGTSFIPMDDALVMVSLDFSRCFVGCEMDCDKYEEGFDIALFEEFLWGLARNAGMTIHIRKISGVNPHHVMEAGFKALGCALKIALEYSVNTLSTKGVL